MDTTSFNNAKNKMISDLICKYHKTKDKKLLEQIYKQYEEDLTQKAINMRKKYSFISKDEEEYMYIVNTSFMDAVNSYKKGQGKFDHYLNTIIHNKKVKFVMKAFQDSKRIINYNMFSDEETLAQNLIFLDSKSTTEHELIFNTYLNELKQRIINQLRLTSNLDADIFELYMQSYTFEEIAEELNVPKKKVISRFYYVKKILKDKFNIDDFI